MTLARALLSAFALCAGAPALAQTAAPDWIIPELLAAAKAEGELTVYSSTNEQEGLPMWKLYTDATGIKVNYVRNAESPMLARIALEARTGQQSWDVHNAGSVHHIPPALALAWEPPLARDIMPEARGPDKRWYGVYAGYNAPQYNTNLVKKEELPASYEDFATKKQWAGKVALEATDREWMAALFVHYGADRGRKILEDIAKALNPVIVDGHFAMARQISAGEYPIALMNYTMLTTNLKQQGQPTDYVPLDPVHLWFGMVGINSHAPHPNAAKLAANFLLSREAQEYASKNGGRIPTRLDVDANPKDVRQKLAEKKIVFLMQNPEETKAAQKVIDEIFRPR